MSSQTHNFTQNRFLLLLKTSTFDLTQCHLRVANYTNTLKTDIFAGFSQLFSAGDTFYHKIIMFMKDNLGKRILTIKIGTKVYSMKLFAILN